MMNEERRDVSLFIGLHKLAEQNGDGLVPELYALLAARAEAPADMTNVVAFSPSAASSTTSRTAASDEANGAILPFSRR